MTLVISLTFEEARSYYVIITIFIIDINTEKSLWSDQLRRHLGKVKDNYIHRERDITAIYSDLVMNG